MGYKRQPIRLVWEEPHELAGLVVRLGRLSVGAILDLGELRRAAGKSSEIEESKEAIESIQEMVAGSLLGWNYEAGDDTPIPPILASVRELDMVMLLEIVVGWIDAMTGAGSGPAGRPLARPSVPPEAIPMEPMTPIGEPVPS